MKTLLTALLIAMAGSISAATCQEHWDDTSLTINDNTACLLWQVPTQNADGTPVVLPHDLAGYKVYYGETSGALDSVVDIPIAEATDYGANQRSYILDMSVTQPTIFYFALTAYDSDGNEAVKSDEISKVVRYMDNGAPNTPANFQIEMRIQQSVPGGELVHP